MDPLTEYRNEYEQWASHVRRIRNDIPEDKTYLYDKFTRELLNYLQTHKMKEVPVFLAREGKEYPVMVVTLDRYAGGDVSDFLSTEFLGMTYTLAQMWKRL